MTRRVLLVEPDATLRAMIGRALGAAGFSTDAVPSIEALGAIDPSETVAMIVELRAATGQGVEAVRVLRARFPEVPLLVTGSLLTPRVMSELIRLRVDDVVPKPFSPRELREALERALGGQRARAHHALEYAAAIEAARLAIVRGRTEDALPPLARARAVAPLDGEAMALLGVACELLVRDADAARAYRAALALADAPIGGEPSARDGLARLSFYDGAPATELPTMEGGTLWFVGDAETELPLGPPTGAGASPRAWVLALGLTDDPTAAGHARLRRDGVTFLLSASRPSEALMRRWMHALSASAAVAHPKTAAALGIVGGEERRST